MDQEIKRRSWRQKTISKRCEAIGLALIISSVGALLAQESSSREVRGELRVNEGSVRPSLTTKADLDMAIKNVESLAHDLRKGLASYHQHLKEAIEIYGRFHDPAYEQQLASFDRDIQTGNADQTAKMKMTLFAVMAKTAGVRLDPNPFRYWADVEKGLDDYQVKVSVARHLMTQASVTAIDRESISPKDLGKLTRKWQAVFQEAEAERARASAVRPISLKAGQTFSAKAAEGLNLRFNIFGIEFGHELGNVTVLARLTYSGRIEDGHLFLLTVLTARPGKTRVDTFVKSRAILVHSNASNALRYGRVVTIHSYDGYNVTGVRLASVAGAVRDWIWKDLPPKTSAATPSIVELQERVKSVQDSRRALDRSTDSFKRLASLAMRQNDDNLRTEVGATQGKARLPEQDLRFRFPEVRARLYASRALLARDARFLAAREAVASARREADGSILQGREVFTYFNRIPVQSAPEFPWKKIDNLAVELMTAWEDVQRAVARADEAIPQVHREDGTGLITRSQTLPAVIVAQVKVIAEETGRHEVLIQEHILRDVHWAIKGIERREYSKELIEVSATGAHEVRQATAPSYVQGSGSISQIFRSIAEKEFTLR